MKKIALIILLLLGGFLGFYLGNLNNSQSKTPGKTPEIKEKNLKPKKKNVEKTAIKSKSIFIPYWTLESENLSLADYDEIIYFGITPNYQGINKQEAGYYGIPTFSKISEAKKKLITLRMIDDDTNNFILKNKDIQEKVIQETLEILEQYQLDGVVLDIEISGLYNQDMTNKINDFVKLLYTYTNKNYRQFYVAIYGDTFYRKRPFDIALIAKNSDGIMVMAYDFHKSRGEPGPNFPYESGARYQYNFKKMISDFSEVVPKDKLTVIFGMFGYDWLVDEKKRPITQAKALSLYQINEKFLGTSLQRPLQTRTKDLKCSWQDCIIKRDPISKELELNYVISADKPDEQDIYRIDYHIVWFEDEESVKAKTEYLQEQGIGNVAYWSYGYF